MEKSSFCTDHFVLNCSLCGGTPPTLPTPPPVQTVIVPDNFTPLPGGNGSSNIVHPEPALKSTQTSPEAVKITSASMEYALACDKYKEDCDAVTAMEQHIAKMTDMLDDLKSARSIAKARKAEMKLRMIEELSKED